MGFINKSRVASVISLGGVCFSLSPITCSQVIAMEEDKYNANEDLSGVFECKLGDFVKSKLNENGKANFKKIKDGLGQNDKLEVLVGLLGKLDENGSLVFSEMINKVNDNGAGNLYLILSKISAVDKGDVEEPYVVKFAGLLNNFNEAGANSFALVLGSESDDLDDRFLNGFGVNSFFKVVLEKLDEQGLYNIARLLGNEEGGEEMARNFASILNSLSSCGVSNFLRFINSLDGNGILNFGNSLDSYSLDGRKLVEKFNCGDFGVDAFVGKLINGGKDLNVGDFISEQGLDENFKLEKEEKSL